MRTEESQENIVVLSDIREERLCALSPYGPVKAGLTTLPSHSTRGGENEARLMELLNSLEREVKNLRYKSFTAYDMLASATENLRAVHSASIEDIIGTEEGML